MKVCDSCGTSLEIAGPDGRPFVFTAHTIEYCRLATLARIRILEESVKRHVLEEAAYRQQCVDLFGRSRGALGALEQVDEMVSLLASGLRGGEGVTSQEVARVLAVVRDGIAAASGTRHQPDERELAKARVQMELVAEVPPPPPAKPRTESRDFHHSMGIETAEIIMGTPLGKACDCGAAVGSACIGDVAAMVLTEYGPFHAGRAS